MKTPSFVTLLAAGIVLLCSTEAEAALSLRKGKLVDLRYVASMPIEKHYEAGLQALEQQKWEESQSHFMIVAVNDPTSLIGQEARFFLGVSYYNLEEYDLANDAFNDYISAMANPKYFIETIEYKFDIAERFSQGAKRRIFGSKRFPKWLSGHSEAAKIYDEVIAAMPSHELAAKALFSKGLLHWESKEYKESIEAFQLVTKRFPKHELAPESYLAIAKVYIDQSRFEYQNPDILAFAEINLRRFKQDFPKEERIAQAQKGVRQIEEIYAHGLYETGQFYETKGQPNAASIYYQSAIKQFPKTSYAKKSRGRLHQIDPAALAPHQGGNTGSKTTSGEDFVLDESIISPEP